VRLRAVTAARPALYEAEFRATARPRPEQDSHPRPLWYDLALAAITTFVAAAAAAWIVFRLQSKKEQRERREQEIRQRQERRDEEVRQLRRVQFAFSLRAATLGDLWNQWLEPALKEGGGHWAALQTPAGFTPPEPLGLERVEFLLETDANLFSRLHQSDRRLHSFLETTNRYSKWREEASARIEERTPRADATGFRAAQVEELAGHRLNYQLKALATGLFENCLSVRGDLMKVFEEVGDLIVKNYQGKRFRVEFEREPSGGETAGGGEPPAAS
jgi:hypothetical protein